MDINELKGNWIYRSFNNITDPVGDDPQKALNLIFGEGDLTIQPNGPSTFHAVLDFGGGDAMDLYGDVVAGCGVSPEVLIITGTGREGTGPAKWVYQYKGYVVPQWAEGVNEVRAIVGTVIRTIPHASGTPGVQAPAGVVASFVILRK